jgi:hypothetical protein
MHGCLRAHTWHGPVCTTTTAKQLNIYRVSSLCGHALCAVYIRLRSLTKQELIKLELLYLSSNKS